MPSLKIAQRSAAFEAIKKLHQCGELSEKLLPINKRLCLKKYKDIYFKTWDKFADGMYLYCYKTYPPLYF